MAESRKFSRRTGNQGRGTWWLRQISHRNINGNVAISRMGNENGGVCVCYLYVFYVFFHAAYMLYYCEHDELGLIGLKPSR